MTSSFPMCEFRSQMAGTAWVPAGYLIAVDGTAYPGCPAPPTPALDDGSGFWAGFSSGMVGGLANMQDGLWESYCIGYSAPTIPMWPGVQEARAGVVARLQIIASDYYRANGSYDGLAIIMTGYSQGSMATDQVWTEDILNPAGTLHYLLPYIYRIYQFGHIFRSPGIAHANALAGLPESIKDNGVETGGIGLELDLTVAQTNHVAPDGKPVVYSAANKGDLYGACPVGLNPWTKPNKEGKVGRLFMKIIMQPTFADIVEVAEVLEEPIAGIEELFHTMSFFAQGMNSPHYQYFPQLTACINDALALGNSFPHQPGY